MGHSGVILVIASIILIMAIDAFPWGAGHGTLRDTRK